MADLLENTSVGKSLDEIAQMMADSRDAMGQRAADNKALRNPNPDPQLGNDEDDNEAEARQLEADGDDSGEGLPADDPQLEDPDATAGDEDTGEEAEEGEPDAGDPADDLEEFEFQDTDLVEIDGLDEPVSFGDLKERFTADTTIATTLAETKAFNETASQTMAKSQEDTQLVKQAMTELVKQVDTLLSQPLVDTPQEALKSSNPGEYIRQVDMYNLDQKRIQDSRNTVTEALNDFGTKQEAFKDTRRAHELGLLSDVLTDLKVDGKREAISQAIVDAAKHYGFSQFEVKEAIDHRIYHMAYDAAQYHKLMAAAKNETNTGGDTREEKARNKLGKQPRLLRSRGTSARKQSTTSAKRIKIAHAKAQATGKPADVAAYMAEKRQQ